MFNSKIKIYIFSVLYLLFNSCSFINLTDLEIYINPSDRNQILEADEAITIGFSEDVKEKTVELLVSLTLNDEKVDVDFFWSTGLLTIQPKNELKPSNRYFLSLSGTIDILDGRKFAKDIHIPFYYLSESALPSVTSFTPENNQSVGVLTPLVLTFTEDMDTELFEDNFSLSPTIEVEMNWDNNKEVTITPIDRWENLNYYTWTVSEDFKSINGLYILEQYSGSFLVQDDYTPPDITEIWSAVLTGSTVTNISPDLNNITYNDVILFVINEPVLSDSFETALSFTPAVEGRIVQMTPSEFVYIPETGWDMTTEYILDISTDLSDTSGNKINTPIKKYFNPGIPEVTITSIDGSGDNNITTSTYNSYAMESIDLTALDNRYSFTIHFSQNYDEIYRNVIESQINCSAFFPTNKDPVLEAIIWNPIGNQLTLVYIDFVPGSIAKPNEKNTYKWIAP